MRILSGLLIFALLSGCAGYRPIVDMKGVDANAYEMDLAECQEFAEQIRPSSYAAVGAVAGAGAAAILGGVLGAVLGLDVGEMMWKSAAVGGTLGVMEGGSAGVMSQVDVVKSCMVGRGYKVLK